MSKIRINKFQTGKVGLVALSHFVNDNYQAFVPLLLPLLIEKHNMTMFMSGMIVFVMRFPSILNPIIGVYADRIRLSSFVIVSPIITALSISLIVLMPNYALVITLLTISGISSAFFHVPGPVLIRSYAGNKTAPGMSFFMFGGELARSTGPMIMLWVLAIWGLEGSWKMFFPGAVIMIVIGFFIKDNAVKTNVHNGRKRDMLFSTFKRLKKVYIIIAGLIFAKSFVLVALTYFLPIYMTNKGVTLFLAGASLSLLELFGAAGAFFSGPISDIIGRKKLLIILFSSAPVLMFAFIFSSGWITVPLLILLGLIIFSEMPIFLAIVQDMEPEFHASANSIYMTINFVISSLVVFFIGWLGDVMDLQTVYIVCAGLALIGIPIVLPLPKDKKIQMD